VNELKILKFSAFADDVLHFIKYLLSQIFSI